MISTASTFAAEIPRWEHTALTVPECSCPPCLRGMLQSVGFVPPAPAPATESVLVASAATTSVEPDLATSPASVASALVASSAAESLV